MAPMGPTDMGMAHGGSLGSARVCWLSVCSVELRSQVAVALWAAPLMMRNCTLHRGGHWSRRRFKPQGSCNDTQCARGREKSPSGQAEAKAVVGLIGERIEGELPAAIDGVQCHVKHLSWRFLMLLFVSIGSLVPHASTGIVILCLGAGLG